jgi:hypothetical protein
MLNLSDTISNFPTNAMFAMCPFKEYFIHIYELCLISVKQNNLPNNSHSAVYKLSFIGLEHSVATCFGS